MKGQEASTIYLPIKIKKEDIEVKINKMIEGVIYEDTNIKEDGLMLRAEKSGKITVSMDSNTFSYRVPLRIWVKKDIGMTAVEAEGEIALVFASAYEIRTDWHLSTNTKVAGYEWLQKPKVRLSLFDFSIKFLADKILQRSKDVICKSIDEQLAQRFDLRNLIMEAWSVLQAPIEVSKDFKIWLQLVPKGVSLNPLKFDGETISSKIFLAANTNALLGEKPIIENTIDLPPFQFSELKEDHFKIQIGASSSFLEAEVLAKKQLIGKVFKSGDRSVKIHDLALNGNGEKLEANVELSGTYNGSVFISGRPFFNAKENLIEFEELEYQLNTKNVLMQGLGWLFHKGIKRQFENAMRFPLEEHLDNIRQVIQENIQNNNIAKGISLTGTVEEIEVQQIQLSPTHIEALLKTKGQLKLEFKNE